MFLLNHNHPRRDEADLGKNYVKVVAVFQLKETRFVLHDHRNLAFLLGARAGVFLLGCSVVRR